MQIKLSAQPSLACRKLHQLLCIFFLFFCALPFLSPVNKRFRWLYSFALSLTLPFFFLSQSLCVCVAADVDAAVSHSIKWHEARGTTWGRRSKGRGRRGNSDKWQRAITCDRLLTSSLFWLAPPKVSSSLSLSHQVNYSAVSQAFYFNLFFGYILIYLINFNRNAATLLPQSNNARVAPIHKDNSNSNNNNANNNNKRERESQHSPPFGIVYILCLFVLPRRRWRKENAGVKEKQKKKLAL